MPQVAAAVAALDAAHVAAVLADGGEVGIAIDGADHTLGAEDVTLALQPLEGYEVEAEAGHAVALQLELDEELRREGLAREIVHAVQIARKDAGLEITDRIELSLGGDEELLAAARDHEAYLAGEVLATAVAYDGDGDGAATTIDGRDARDRRAADVKPIVPRALPPRCSRVSGHRVPVETPSRPRRARSLALAPALCRAGRAPPRRGGRTRRRAASTAAGTGRTGRPAKPQLLLFHGGSFLFEDPIFEPLDRRPARSPPASSRTTSTYPLGDMPAAVAGGAGGSAGGCATRSGSSASTPTAPRPAARWRRCSPATAWSPPRSPRRRSPTWSAGNGRWTAYGPDYYEQVGLDLAARYRLSPLRRPAESPLLIYQGRADQVVPPAMSEAFAAKFERVHLWQRPGRAHDRASRDPGVVAEGDAAGWREPRAACQATAVANGPAARSRSPLKSTDGLRNESTSSAPEGGFRPDIEGMRAIAIVAVLLCHAGIPFLAGGYVGVDVFFVISGFLITRLLLGELDRSGGDLAAPLLRPPGQTPAAALGDPAGHGRDPLAA